MAAGRSADEDHFPSAALHPWRPRLIFRAIACKARHERSSDVRAEGYVCDMRVEFVFDYPSRYAYLASTQLESLGVPVGYEPIGIVEVMKRVDNQPSPACPPKARYAGIDAARWAHRYGVPFEINQAFLTALGTGTFDH
jgi:hypothetical protein